MKNWNPNGLPIYRRLPFEHPVEIRPVSLHLADISLAIFDFEKCEAGRHHDELEGPSTFTQGCPQSLRHLR